MTSVQYEALCRYVISQIYGIPLSEIHGGHLLGMCHRGQKTRHQIDLYWDVFDGTLSYRVFANAKWRTDNVEVMDIMALIGVWRDIGAHKAVLITNTGFDIGVRKQAEEKGIGLLVVRPTMEFEGLGTRGVPVVVEQIVEIAKGKGEVFEMEVVHKGWEGTKARRHEGTEGRALRGSGLEGRSDGGGEGENGRQGDKETGRQGDGNAGEDWMGGGWTTIGGEGGGGGGGGEDSE